jgi:hypothetical protein
LATLEPGLAQRRADRSGADDRNAYELPPGFSADACPFSVIVMQQLPRLYYEMDRFHSE